jgi:hypothetical protein
MSNAKQYLSEWFNKGFPIKVKNFDRETVKEWFLTHANVQDFLLRLDYVFGDTLCLTISTTWDGCDELAYWTDGRERGWVEACRLPTLQKVLTKSHHIDFTEKNDEFLSLLTGYLHSVVLPRAREFEKKKYTDCVTTQTSSGYVIYTD